VENPAQQLDRSRGEPHGCAVRRLRPQGVVSGGFNSPGSHWFGFVLLVLTLVVIHAVVSNLALETTMEVRMEKAKTAPVTALNKAKLVLVSLINTMWAIGTSVAAGALSA